MHDIRDMEERGLIGVGIASSEFIPAAAAQNAALGYDPAVVFVPHPIQDRTDAEMRELAERAFDEILRAVGASA